MNAFISLILASVLLLSGGATVAAAQDDLPTQSLYQLKVWTENAKLAMTGEPQEQANLLMTMAQTRVQEMAALAEMGVTPPDQVRTRLEEHLRQTLMLATDMDEADLIQTLLQLRDQLQTQDRLMQQLLTHANIETEPLLTRTRQMLQTHLQLVDQGLADPQGFRYMMNNQMQYGQESGATPEPNQQGEPGFHQNGPDGQPAEEPGAGNGNNNNAGNDPPGGPNPDKPLNGYGGNDSGDQEPNLNQERPQGGNGSGTTNDENSSGSGNDGGGGPGGGGGNK